MAMQPGQSAHRRRLQGSVLELWLVLMAPLALAGENAVVGAPAELTGLRGEHRDGSPILRARPGRALRPPWHDRVRSHGHWYPMVVVQGRFDRNPPARSALPRARQIGGASCRQRGQLPAAEV